MKTKSMVDLCLVNAVGMLIRFSFIINSFSSKENFVNGLLKSPAIRTEDFWYLESIDSISYQRDNL